MKKLAKKPIESQQSISAQLLIPLAALIRSDLLSLVHDLGMQAISTMLEEERTQLCGARYVHDSARNATRGGSVRGELALGGRRVAVRRPRVVDADGVELPLQTWRELSSRDALDARALEQMAIGVATRKYGRSLEALPPTLATRGASKSAISRRFVALTSNKLMEWMARPLIELDIQALFIDGIHFRDHVVLCALGLDTNGRKHVLGIWEGATENEVACASMIENLIERGLPQNRALLFIIDGSKGLRSAIRTVFGKRACVQRCQVHKMRNVVGHLPPSKHAEVRRDMNVAYKQLDVASAKRKLLALAKKLQKKHPSAAASLQEGLDETLTVLGLNLSASLTRTLSTTNPIENMNGRIRAVARRVKRWDGGTMILRWVLVGVLEAARGFRRIKGYRDMKSLIVALKQRMSSAPIAVDEQRFAA
jgi:putative transposase